MEARIVLPPNSDDLRLGYTTAVGLMTLVSQEIYSRFGAMLTAHSIIVAVIGVLITSSKPSLFILCWGLPIIGLFLCFLWYKLNKQGIDRQSEYRKAAKKLEQHFNKTFFLLNREGESNREVKGKSEHSLYGQLSRCVIGLFAVLYVIALISIALLR